MPFHEARKGLQKKPRIYAWVVDRIRQHHWEIRLAWLPFSHNHKDNLLRYAKQTLTMDDLYCQVIETPSQRVWAH
eukprot:scaffold58607_cov18-Prasinocladus_malaysianus.AAC.1